MNTTVLIEAGRNSEIDKSAHRRIDKEKGVKRRISATGEDTSNSLAEPVKLISMPAG